MADGVSYTKPQRLASSTTAPNKNNPRHSKFYTHFLFKALIVTIFLVIIPLFPSEAPDNVSSSFFTRGWELLHLIFVGIAVSYGLFSRRNDDSQGENHSKFDNAQSYMSRLLQVSSVFDDEGENSSGSDDNTNTNTNNINNSSKVQTWSSQYYRNQPTTVVAKNSSSGVGEKPLLLPVRSLKSRVSDGNDDVELVNGGDHGVGVTRVYARSNSSPSTKGLLSNSRRISRNNSARIHGEDSGVSKAYARSYTSPTVKDDSRRMRRNLSMDARLPVPNEYGYVDHEDGMVSGSLSRNRSMEVRLPLPNEHGYVDHEDSMVSRSLSRNRSMDARLPVPNEYGYVDHEDSMASRSLNRNQSMDARLPLPNEYGYVDHEDSMVSRTLGRSNSDASPRGFLRKSSSGNYGGLDDENMEEKEEKKVEENVRVLPSPIPWRSRSGRIEMKGESDDSSVPSSPFLPLSLDEIEAARTLRSQSTRSSRSNSSSSSPTKVSPSPKKLSPAPSMSLESFAKSMEDFGKRKIEDYGKKKIVYSSRLPPPPPPPPPPPRPPIHRSRLVKPISSMDNKEISSNRKDVKRSVWSEPKDIGREISEELWNRENAGLEAKARNGTDISLMGKSVRTVRPGGTTVASGQMKEIDDEERMNEVEAPVTEKPERKTPGYNPMSNASFAEFPQETRDFLEQVLVETTDESESEDDHYVEQREEERVESPKVEEMPSSSVTDEGPDVDKKADEFIAKFREQIRLQRIESIKRSTNQLKRSSMR